jgi:hypothetical protein
LCNNGTTQKYILESDFHLYPDYKPGMLESEKSKKAGELGKHWYNDGNRNYKIFDTDIKINNLNLRRSKI